MGGPQGRQDCASLSHHPVILVHDNGEGPERWFEGPGGGTAGALAAAGFTACEIWAVRLGERGRPMRSLEELTDDLAFFMGSVLAYSGAPRVQLLAEGEGAIIAHATLAKYRLHPLVHAAVYLEAPFQARADCSDTRCFEGEPSCCALGPGSTLLARITRPPAAPLALGSGGHLRYLTLGAGARDGWGLAGSTEHRVPGLGASPLESIAEAWSPVLEALGDPAAACDPADDADGDGFCARSQGGADCDDGDPAIHPGADELEADGVDQNCNDHDVDRRFPGWACERPLDGADRVPPSPPSPSWRMASLSAPVDGDWDKALARCRDGRFADEPMPDRHPHAQPSGPHYRDLGFIAPTALEEPWASRIQAMIDANQGCALFEGSRGPVLLARMQGSGPAVDDAVRGPGAPSAGSGPAGPR
jgi:hypothetical protein